MTFKDKNRRQGIKDKGINFVAFTILNYPEIKKVQPRIQFKLHCHLTCTSMLCGNPTPNNFFFFITFLVIPSPTIFLNFQTSIRIQLRKTKTPDRPFHNFGGFKVCRATFLNYIKYVDPRIFSLSNCERARRVILWLTSSNWVKCVDLRI